MIEAIERQIKPAILAVMTSVATLTSVGAGKVVPQNGVNRSVKQAPTVQRGKNVQYGKQVPGVQVVKGVSGQNIKNAPQKTNTNSVPAVAFSIPSMPELKFSSKLAGIPLPKVERKSLYEPEESQRLRRNDALRAAVPYIPDIVYEKSKLPYAERMKFMKSEYWKIEDALRKEFDRTVGEKLVWHLNLRTHVVYICRELLIYGRPVATLPTETNSVREAIDLCGLTQLGYWIDIQKAKNREFNVLIPEGYDEQEALQQKKYLREFYLIYGETAYNKAMGLTPKKPISADCPCYTARDFAHLTQVQRNKLLDMFKLLPENVKKAPALGARETIRDYQEILADKTGYGYIHKHVSSMMPTEMATKAQKLSLEILTYGQPLILLKGKRYSLEQIMYVCRFRQAEDFYRRQQGKHVEEKMFDEVEQAIYNREAKAMMALGEKFKHPEWVQFGDNMLKHVPPLQIAVKKADKGGTRTYYTEADFAHLPAAERSELKRLLKFIPQDVQLAPDMSTKGIYKLYQEIQSDQTGYSYVHKCLGTNVPKDLATKIQKLCLEIVIYKRPLALLRAEDYSLEQVMKVCHFRFAEGFYEMQQKGLRRTGEVSELGFTMGNLEANALINLGKRYNHSDWVEFGQEMYKACQNRIVVKNINRPLVQKVIKLQETVRKHDDSQMIQNQVAKVADEPRVRNQDDSTNATSRVKRDADNGMK